MAHTASLKPLSLSEIRARAGSFSRHWSKAEGDERQEGQLFIRGLLEVFGVSDVKAALYEKRAERSSTGNRGYIDALIPGLAVFEMKSAGKDLGLAEIQALDYLNALPESEQPRFVISSNFKTIRVLDLLAEKQTDTVQFGVEELPRHAENLAFLAGYQKASFGSHQQEKVSIKAARVMADLYLALDSAGYDNHSASVFLVRTLFCLYADNAGVWERDIFLDFLENRTSVDGSDLGPQLAMLFQVLDQPTQARATTLDPALLAFPYVNGTIFSELLSIPAFDKTMREKLIAACHLDWASISPAIFGSLFQAVKSSEARRELGEHYTTETNIRKVIEPLFLDELWKKFDVAKSSSRNLQALRDELAQIRVLDPACGCGNFLVLAFRELREIETAILLRLQELGEMNTPALYFDRQELAVRIENFAGIEIEEWPSRIAAVALRLADHQSNMRMQLVLGRAPETLPLDKSTVIRVGNAIEIDWNEIVPDEATIILGNPPFVGMAWMTREQQAHNRDAFSPLSEAKGLRTGRLDYVACWYAKAFDYMRSRPAARSAFVSTSSIAQGEQARTLGPLLGKIGLEVDFAHRSFSWSSEAPDAAAVHCVIIGFSSKERKDKERRIFSYPVGSKDPVEAQADRINFYLFEGSDFVPPKLRRPFNPEMPMATQGSKPVDGGNLLLSEGEAEVLLKDEDLAPYLRRFVQAKDMLQGKPSRWCLWLKDAPPAVLKKREVAVRLEEVRRSRLQSPTDSVRELAAKPMMFTQDRQPEGPYFALPEVSSENQVWIPGRFYDANSVAGNKLIIFPAADDWHAAYLQSSMFMSWIETFSGRLESRFSISPALCYFPIPFPSVDGHTKSNLAEAWMHVVETRGSFPNATLRELYNSSSMPAALIDAHMRLDRVVDKVFGLETHAKSNSDRVKFLVELIQRS